MTDKARMEKGLLYHPMGEEIFSQQLKQLEKLYDFNATRPLEQEKRQNLLKEMFADIGKNCYIEPPLYANCGGAHVHFGDGVYANFGLTLVDDTDIYVGDSVMFGPNVTVCTAAHPICPELRVQGYQYNKKVVIKNNVWIGANTMIMPGVTVGENSVIGACSVVTKDIPANTVSAGNPCKVMRDIGDRDNTYFYRDEKIDWENLK